MIKAAVIILTKILKDYPKEVLTSLSWRNIRRFTRVIRTESPYRVFYNLLQFLERKRSGTNSKNTINLSELIKDSFLSEEILEQVREAAKIEELIPSQEKIHSLPLQLPFKQNLEIVTMYRDVLHILSEKHEIFVLTEKTSPSIDGKLTAYPNETNGVVFLSSNTKASHQSRLSMVYLSKYQADIKDKMRCIAHFIIAAQPSVCYYEEHDPFASEFLKHYRFPLEQYTAFSILDQSNN